MALQNLDDPKNVAGLFSLLDNDDIDSNFDLSELEREIANGMSIVSEDVNSEDGTSTTTYSETYLSGDRSES